MRLDWLFEHAWSFGFFAIAYYWGRRDGRLETDGLTKLTAHALDVAERRALGNVEKPESKQIICHLCKQPIPGYCSYVLEPGVGYYVACVNCL